jgi:hypothetical protein
MNGELLTAFQEQPLCVVTVICGELAAAGTVAVVGETLYEQVPFWLTVTVWFAIVSVPVRGASDAPFDATLKTTLPFPLPPGPLVMVMNGELLTAVHAHPAWAPTFTVSVAPLGTTVNVVADTVNVHPTPACVTVSCAVEPAPANVMWPVRVAFETFGPTVYAMVLLPDPEAPLVMSSHGESVDAVQAHEAERAVVKLPPPAGAFCAAGPRPRLQGTIPGWTTTSCADEPPPVTVIVPVRDAVVGFAATE